MTETEAGRRDELNVMEERVEEETVSPAEPKKVPRPAVNAETSDIVVDANNADVITYSGREIRDPADGTVSAKAQQARQSAKELVEAVGNAAKEKIKEASNKVEENWDIIRPDYVDAKNDAKEIGRLSMLAENLAASFEQTMSVIQAQDYEDQEDMLLGYRTLLEEQLNLIEARQKMAKRLKRQ